MSKQQNATAAALFLRGHFEVDAARLSAIAEGFGREILHCAAGKPGSLATLLTFLGPPESRLDGQFLAIDLGGTNLRVLLASISGGETRVIHQVKRKLTRKDNCRKSADLFDAIALDVAAFVNEHGIPPPHPIGFTFSFPFHQESLTSARIMKWTKGFDMSDGPGLDIIGLMNSALAQKKVADGRIAAIINDTTGTLLAGAAKDPACRLGMILGTGTNICAELPCSMIGKPRGGYTGKSMYVNLESGNFDKNLPRNRFDEELDRASSNPGHQWEEKMVSGLYLGELAGIVLRDMHENGLFLKAAGPGPQAGLSKIAAEDLAEAGLAPAPKLCKTLVEGLGLRGADEEDALVFKDAAAWISRRSARISAALVAGCVKIIEPALDNPQTVAIDGSLFQRYPGYGDMMRSALEEILGNSAEKISLVQASDGSGIGAAIAAAVATKG